MPGKGGLGKGKEKEAFGGICMMTSGSSRRQAPLPNLQNPDPSYGTLSYLNFLYLTYVLEAYIALQNIKKEETVAALYLAVQARCLLISLEQLYCGWHPGHFSPVEHSSMGLIAIITTIVFQLLTLELSQCRPS